jgi:NNP family nitrate/nitrite transporter-like MFS transporter
VGALGGVGGFLLPTLLGSVRQQTGSFAYGFAALAILAAIAAIFLRALVSPRGKWSGMISAAAGSRDGALTR